jgi:hypothetical protein
LLSLVNQLSDRFQVLLSPEDRPDREIAKLIDQAQKSVHVAMFTFKDSGLSKALVRAAKRGVQVELVTESKQASRTQEDEKVARAGAKVVVGANTSAPHAAMHQKYAVIDQRIVLTGACNWTYTAFHHSEEDVLIVRDIAIAKAYLTDFADLMKRYDSGYMESDYSWQSGCSVINFICKDGDTEWGESVYVVGNQPALGQWDPAKAIRLESSSSNFPKWSGLVELPVNAAVEYKYIRKKNDGTLVWESGFNRTLSTSTLGRNETRSEAFRD